MKTYSQLAESLKGRCATRRKVANHTYLIRIDEKTIAVQLHQTHVVTFHEDGRIVANTGGWKTPTTKERLNDYLPSRVWQDKGRWYLGSNGSTVEFADGITFHPDGSITGAKPKADADREKELQKRILAYCRTLSGHYRRRTGLL